MINPQRALMNSRFPPSNSYSWAAPHESMPPSTGSQIAHGPDNPTLPRSGTASSIRFAEDQSIGCVNRNALIHWAMSQVQPHEYFSLPSLNDWEQRFGATFISDDGARCAVRAVFRLGGDHTLRLERVEYRGPETSYEGVTAQVEHPAIAHESAPYSAEVFPTHLPSPSGMTRYDPTQGQRSYLGGRAPSPSAPWLDHQYASGNVEAARTDDQDLSFERMTARRQGQEEWHRAPHRAPAPLDQAHSAPCTVHKLSLVTSRPDYRPIHPLTCPLGRALKRPGATTYSQRLKGKFWRWRVKNPLR